MNHPSENELQQYLLEKTTLSSETIQHIDSCTFCKESILAYAILFAGITSMPSEKFNFDLKALVLPQLPQADTNPFAEKIIAGFLVLFIGCFIGIPVFLFRKNITNVFNGIPSFFLLCDRSKQHIHSRIHAFGNVQKISEANAIAKFFLKCRNKIFPDQSNLKDLK